jgi:hypothetical protein
MCRFKHDLSRIFVPGNRKEEPDDLHLIPPPHMKLHTKDVRGGRTTFPYYSKMGRLDSTLKLISLYFYRKFLEFKIKSAFHGYSFFGLIRLSIDFLS